MTIKTLNKQNRQGHVYLSKYRGFTTVANINNREISTWCNKSNTKQYKQHKITPKDTFKMKLTLKISG